MIVKECDGCMTTAMDINGVANPVPPGASGMTAAEQSSNNIIGSGDAFGKTQKIATQTQPKRKKVKFIRKFKK